MTHNPLKEEYLKEEMRNLRQEYIHAQNEVKRIASIPLMIGHFLEGIDATTCIVAPTSGQNFKIVEIGIYTYHSKGFLFRIPN